MKKWIGLLLTGAMALTLSTTASAALHVEPYLGYAISGHNNATPENDYTSKGPIFGARLGWGMMGLFVAGEYELAPMEIDSSPAVDADQTNMGISVGYEFPILLRVYGTYVFNAVAEVSSGEYQGNGTKLGVGYTGLPFVAINFEMSKGDYDEFENNSGNTSTVNYKTTYYSVNVSLPLSF